MHILNSRISVDILQWHVNCGSHPTRLLCGGLFYYYFFNFETGSYYVTLTDPGTYCVDQAGLKLRHFCVCLPSAGVEDVCCTIIPCMPCGFLMVDFRDISEAMMGWGRKNGFFLDHWMQKMASDSSFM